jgi:phosphoglycolate phosphatase-like HAD superfamily hydrolase
MDVKTFIFDFDYTIHNLHEIYTKAMIRHSVGNDGIIMRNVEAVIENEKKKGTDAVIINQMIFRNPDIKIGNEDIDFIVGEIDKVITPGIINIIGELERKGNKVLIIGGGAFGCAVIPRVMKKYCFNEQNIYSGYFNGFDQVNMNKTIYDDYRYVNHLAQNEITPISPRKSEIIKFLKQKNKISGKVIMIGDGENDLEVFKLAEADYFIGYGLHKIRKKVKQESPIFVENMKDFRKIIFEL